MKIAIVGYGNLGRACEALAIDRGLADVVGIFTRRDVDSVSSLYDTKVYRQEDIFRFEGDIDVAVVCTGSANDVFDLTGRLLERFNTADSFDTHNKMREYVARLDEIGRLRHHTAIVGAGWDPGLFSMARALFEGVMGRAETFWGRGVSQGHSEAIRRIDGVIDARQYTIPIDEAVLRALNGDKTPLADRQKHRRVCYVAVASGADKERIKREIQMMPNYFAGYSTEVNFISEEELLKEHSALPHAGRVICADGHSLAEFRLKLESNPTFTAGVLLSYALAGVKMNKKGEYGAKTLIDIPLSALVDDPLKYV